MKFPLSRRLAAEFLGTAFLVAAVVGSGIMGERLSGGNLAIALLANTIATGAALAAIARSLTNTFTGIRPVDVPAFLTAQLAGGFLAVLDSGWLTRSQEETERNLECPLR